MKKSLSYVFLIAMLFVFTACPYSADFPLEQATEKVDKKYLGSWIEEDSDEKNPTFYKISKLTNSTYQFEKNEYSTEKKKYTQTPYIGHSTQIGEVLFFNLKDEENKYFFYKLVLSTDKKKFSLHEVTDNIDERFADATEMKTYFDKYKDLSFFYNKDEKKYSKK